MLSTLSMKSMVSADANPNSMGMQGRPPPALMYQSMGKETAQHMKSPQIVLGGMFASDVSPEAL